MLHHWHFFSIRPPPCPPQSNALRVQCKAWLNVCFICPACAVNRAGVTPLQSGGRYKGGGGKEGGEGRQEWVKSKEDRRSLTPGGPGSEGRRDSRQMVQTFFKFAWLSSHHTFCSSSFVASHPSPFLPSALFLHMRHSRPSVSISLYLLCTLLCPAHTRALPLFPRSTFFTCVSLTVLSLRLRWWYTRHRFPFLSELYPNPSVRSLSSYASVSHSPVLSFPPVPDWIIIIPQMDFCSDDSAFRMNI